MHHVFDTRQNHRVCLHKEIPKIFFQTSQNRLVYLNAVVWNKVWKKNRDKFHSVSVFVGFSILMYKIQISACISSIGKRFKPQDGAWLMWVNSKLALCLSVNICKNSPTSYYLYFGAREFYVMICFLRGSNRGQK